MDKEWFRLQGIRPVMLVLAVVSLLQGASIITQAVFLSKAITLLFEGNPLSEAYIPLLWFLIAFIARHTLVWLQQQTAGRFAERTSEGLREQLLDRIFKKGPGFAAKEGSGKLVTLALEGVDKVRTYLELSIPRMIDMMVITLTILFFVFRLDFLSGIIVAAAMPILIIFFILLGLAARKMADKQWQTYRRLSHHFTDTLRGLETLRFLGRSKAHGETVGRAADQYRTATMRTLRIAFLSSFSLDFFSMLSIAFVAVGLGVRLIEGAIGIEASLIILLLAPEYFLPVRMLGTDYHASLDGKEAWATIRSITEEELMEGCNQGSTSPITATKEEHADVSLTDLSNLKLQQISVTGDEGRMILSNISVQAAQGVRKIGIAGRSGAGKSTLLNVLSGFREWQKGEVMLNGVSLHADSMRAWQQQIAYIPQHPYIFSGTLADNIAFYEPDAAAEQIEKAIEAVGLRQWVNQLPEGMNEKVGEGGRIVSGGQAQRIALARAFLGNRPIILLDEPTAHLDIETEWELKQNMLKLFADKSFIIATHRLHWMKDVDEVWLVHEGQMIATGTHEQLKQENDIYKELLKAGKR